MLSNGTMTEKKQTEKRKTVENNLGNFSPISAFLKEPELSMLSQVHVRVRFEVFNILRFFKASSTELLTSPDRIRFDSVGS